MIVFLTRIPPFDQRRKLLEGHRASLGVILDTFWQDVFVKPHVFRRGDSRIAPTIDGQRIG